MAHRRWKMLWIFMFLMALALIFSSCDREMAEDAGELVFGIQSPVFAENDPINENGFLTLSS